MCVQNIIKLSAAVRELSCVEKEQKLRRKQYSPSQPRGQWRFHHVRNSSPHYLVKETMLRRKIRYLFGSNSITYNDTNDKIKQISRARLPENPEVNHAGHPNIQFLVYHETTTTTTILLKNTQRKNTEKKQSDYTLADDKLWTNQVFYLMIERWSVCLQCGQYRLGSRWPGRCSARRSVRLRSSTDNRRSETQWRWDVHVHR